ncbi:MAG: hypothetical protein ISR76_11020 [Planctomycetes bacterium]|nr:hypothetical protein [Planctomycetota bacterium]MBL7009522.1 hypothetical protein [Planctomycetota bacterium]
MLRSRSTCLLLLILTACGGGPEEARSPGQAQLPGLGGQPLVPRPEVDGLLRKPDIPDGVPRIDSRLGSGALITLVEIAAAPELEPHPTGFYLEITADGQPRLTALEWGGGPPPPSLGRAPDASDEEALEAWSALSRVPRRSIVVLYLDEETTLGQAEPVLEVLALRDVQTVLWGFSGAAPEGSR